jgi:hypothetical protein
VPYRELAEGLRFCNVNQELIDTRVRRTVAHAFDEVIDRNLVTLDMSFYGTVAGISYPAADAELERLLPRPCPEENALHASPHPNAARNH